jgi:hypothetical protein
MNNKRKMKKKKKSPYIGPIFDREAYDPSKETKGNMGNV